MIARIYPQFEHHVSGIDADLPRGESLARVLEAHPALTPLLEFTTADPLQIAREVGMVYPGEEDADDDLNEIDFGPSEWFEPSAGLAAVGHGIEVLRRDPQSVAQAIYDPGLKVEAVVADLEAIERVLELAQQHEVRFHFLTEG